TINPSDGNYLIVAGDSGTNVFNNVGTFTKQGAGVAEITDINSSLIPVAFNNTGTVNVQAGTLALYGGGTHTGDFTGQAGAKLIFAGNHTFAASSHITGNMDVRIGTEFGQDTFNYLNSLNTTGTVSFSGGTATLGGSIAAGTLQVNTAPVN